MFIVWGRKLVYRKVGYVADFCPMCRKASSFEFKRVGSAGHVYYITAGEGQLVGYERICTTCSTTFNAKQIGYASVAQELLPLPELIAATFPNLYEVIKERLELEEKVRLDPLALPPGDRHALIRSPFLMLSPKVEKRFSATHIDLEVGLSLVGGLVCAFATPAVLRVIAPAYMDQGFLVAIGLWILLVGWQAALSGRRFMRRQIIPSLAKTLAPLRPTMQELRAVSDEMKQFRHKIGSKLRLDDLVAHLRESGRTA